jgi:SAM-dependent methyltransferase
MSYDLYHKHGGEVYDLLYGDRMEDIPFWVTLAEELCPLGSPILELGVGTGRVAIPLARMRHQHGVKPDRPSVYGLDNSPRMLRHARDKLARTPQPVQRQLELIVGDMQDRFVPLREARHRDPSIPEKFGLIFAAFNTLLHVEDFQGLLRHVENMLAYGGWFAFEVFMPDPRRLTDQVEEVLDTDRIDPETGRRARRWEYNRKVDLARQHIFATHRLLLEQNGQTLVEDHLAFNISYIWPSNLRHWIDYTYHNYFEIVHWWADYDRTDFWSVEHPERQIVVCWRKRA